MRAGKTGEKKIIGRSVARDPKEKEGEKERKANVVLSLLPVSDLDVKEREKVPEAGHQGEVLGSLGPRPADALTLASLQAISVNQARCTRTT